jgi:hypothetical protein
MDNLLISERLSEEMVIGAKTMQEWKIRLDPETEGITVGKDIKKMKMVKGPSLLKLKKNESFCNEQSIDKLQKMNITYSMKLAIR